MSAIYTLSSQALKIRSVRVSVPQHVTLKSPAHVVKLAPGEYRLYLAKSTVFPMKLTLTDLFGAHVELLINDPSELKGLKIETAIVNNPKANPVEIFQLPALCSRTTFDQTTPPPHLIYDMKRDIVNERPTVHLFDPDIKSLPQQRQILKNFDHRNVLTIKRVKIRYDYEDDTILDFSGMHPFHWGRPHQVYEGSGGFYANFHYAVIPYDKRVLKLGRQELLNLAQGKLANIDRLDLTPALRTHSFIPGPYQSGRALYELCEWGDTSFQAKEQALTYTDFKIWDWDLKDMQGKSPQKLILIVWEGDEEDWMIADKLLDPFYLTDDVVGVFEIERGQTLKPLLLQNKRRDFEVELLTE